MTYLNISQGDLFSIYQRGRLNIVCENANVFDVVRLAKVSCWADKAADTVRLVLAAAVGGKPQQPYITSLEKTFTIATNYVKQCLPLIIMYPTYGKRVFFN